VGDVLRMGTRIRDPLVVFVGDRPKYYAQPFADNGHLYAEICGLYPRELYAQVGVT
jgi:flagellar motor switch protein FliM